MNWDRASELLHQHVVVTTTVKIKPGSQDVQPEFLKIDNKLLDQERKLMYTGYLKALDPITKCTILCSIDRGAISNNILILGNNIDEIRISCTPEVISTTEVERIIKVDTLNRQSKHPYFAQRISSLTAEELHRRRDDILEWLARNRIPAILNQDGNEIVIADSVKLKAPYESSSDYICPTRVVLKRVKQIVDSRNTKAERKLIV